MRQPVDGVERAQLGPQRGHGGGPLPHVGDEERLLGVDDVAGGAVGAGRVAAQQTAQRPGDGGGHQPPLARVIGGDRGGDVVPGEQLLGELAQNVVQRGREGLARFGPGPRSQKLLADALQKAFRADAGGGRGHW